MSYGLIAALLTLAIGIVLVLRVRRRVAAHMVGLHHAASVTESRVAALADDLDGAISVLDRYERLRQLEARLDYSSGLQEALDTTVAAVVEVEGISAAAVVVGAGHQWFAAVAGVDRAGVDELIGERSPPPQAGTVRIERTDRSVRVRIPLLPTDDSTASGTLTACASTPELPPAVLAELGSIAAALTRCVGNDEPPTGQPAASPTAIGARLTLVETLRSEVGRARRDGTPLTLLVIELDGLDEIHARGGWLASHEAVEAVCDCIRSAVAGGIVVCRLGLARFAVILPRATHVDAEALLARLGAAVSRLEPRAGAPPTLRGSVAELGAGCEDALTLLVSATSALERVAAPEQRSHSLGSG